MDSMGAIISEGDWSCLSGMYSTEEADFMAQLLGNFPLPDHHHDLDGSSNFGSYPSNCNYSTTISMMTTSASGNSYSSSFSQGSSSHSGGSSSVNLFTCSSSQDSFYLSDHSNPIFVANNNNNNSPMSMDQFCMEDVANNPTSYLVEGDHDHCLNQNQEMGILINGNHVAAVKTHQHQEAAAAPATPIKNLEPKREPEQMPKPEQQVDNKTNNMSSESCKKRSRSTGDNNVQKTRKNARSKKNQVQSTTTVSTTSLNINVDEDGNGNGNGGLNGQSSTSCSSEDDCSINASLELNGGVSSSSVSGSALNSNGKTRASRGAATDPQSLYARKRRERINERLRILQNLVPNGTKVDISTMLEEAVQYVKFLQLQIKLLSSDDLWMYAPIAYNGMDIGLDHLKVKLGAAGATPKLSS